MTRATNINVEAQTSQEAGIAKSKATEASPDSFGQAKKHRKQATELVFHSGWPVSEVWQLGRFRVKQQPES